MECPCLRTLSYGFHFCPFALINIVRVNVVKSILIGVDPTEDYHALVTND
jgi:hypothetical protein